MADGTEDASGGGEGDPRVELISQICLRMLKVKPDKWTKMASTEENMQVILSFLDKAEKRLLIIYLTSSGTLLPMTSFPSSLKNKAVYYVKRSPEAIKKENLKSLLTYGGMSSSPLDQFSSFIDSVSSEA